MSRGVIENPNEYLRVVDPVTGGILYCINKQHLRTSGWCERWLLSNQDLIPTIDVTSCVPFDSKFAFTHDSMVDQRKIEQFVDMLIDFSCLIDSHLRRYRKVIVHCKNGRSRSPSVILGFFILRGLSREHATQWLNTAFQSQRPMMTAKSANFPNFPKFSSVIAALETRCSTELSRLEIKERVDKNMSSLSNSSSSSSSSTSSFDANMKLCGVPWSGSYLIPRRLKGSLKSNLPSTSFISAPKVVPVTGSGGDPVYYSIRLRQKTAKSNISGPNTGIHTAGRRVKVLLAGFNNKRKRDQLQQYRYGTLLRQVDEEKWSIEFDFENNNRETHVVKNIFVAFPKGTRV